jgi:hypothetical protein
MVNLPPSPVPLLLDSVDVQHVILQREKQYSLATLRASRRGVFAELERISPRQRLAAPPKKQVA